MIDIFDRNARIARKLMDRVADGVDAELEHAAAIHGQHALAICGGLKRRGTDQTGNAQRLDVGRRRKLNGKGVVSPSPITAAPAPSPKSTQVARSVQSSARVICSAATTSTCSARPRAI